jgi:hypothetical protein
MTPWMERKLFGRINGAWLGVLRVGFGAVMLYEALWFLGWLPGSVGDSNRIETLFVGEHVQWAFPYRDCPWARPLPEPLTTALFVLLGVASMLVIAGTLYRLAAITVFITFSFVNLMDASIYLNHFYLECLVALLMIFVPANRRYSMRWRANKGDDLHDVPWWTIGLFRAQMLFVYFFAGVAKLNGDWLQGEPLRRWLPHPSTGSALDPWLGVATMDQLRRWLGQESTVLAISYGGLLFDLCIGFFLLWRPTRRAAFLAAILFHATNSLLFDIGAFPFLAVLLTTVFFEPDWPERRVRLAGRHERSLCPASCAKPLGAQNAYLAPLLVIWLLLQASLPLRHWMIPGEVSWTEEGHRFSWHMKLRDKYPGRLLIEIAAPVENNASEVRYRHVDATQVPWDELPALVVTYEPILGERVIFNPLAGTTWTEALAAARQRWAADSGQPLQLSKTRSLDETLGRLARQLDAAVDRQVPQAAAARHTLDELLALRRALTGPERDSDRMHLQFRFQDALRRLTHFRPWRKPLLAALWQSPPFACQGAALPAAPLMIVANPSVLLPDEHACSRLDRQACPDLGPTLIDLHQLASASLRSLPETIAFDDYDGRPAVFWNYTYELHRGQIEALAVSPLLQHTYVQHVAERWERQVGVRPQVYVTSFVKLNQHPMQPIVDPRVDLAGVPRQRMGHHAWILPLRRADDPRPVPASAAIARRPLEMAN